MATSAVARSTVGSIPNKFSFGDYYNPKRMVFGPLRILNEDRVEPGASFGPHPHRDMEIISYVIDGAVEHRDSMGSGSAIRPGEIQYMRAGTGVTHSEFNASKSVLVHFLQIWIVPGQSGAAPHYDQQLQQRTIKDFYQR